MDTVTNFLHLSLEMKVILNTWIDSMCGLVLCDKKATVFQHPALLGFYLSSVDMLIRCEIHETYYHAPPYHLDSQKRPPTKTSHYRSNVYDIQLQYCYFSTINGFSLILTYSGTLFLSLLFTGAALALPNS
jgi:hypothetical protein